MVLDVRTEGEGTLAEGLHAEGQSGHNHQTDILPHGSGWHVSTPL